MLPLAGRFFAGVSGRKGDLDDVQLWLHTTKIFDLHLGRFWACHACLGLCKREIGGFLIAIVV